MRRVLLCFALVSAPTTQAQWTLQQSHTTASLRGIHSIGNGIAWASGTEGTVLRTTDSGRTWQTCTIPPAAEHLDFRAIQAFDAQTAIVMSSGKGDLSRLYKTTDACKSWKLFFTNPDPEGFWDALHFKGSSGALLGDPVNGSFVLYLTNDGGQHWVRQQNRGLGAANQQGAFAASNSSLYESFGFILFGTGGPQGTLLYTLSQVTICLDDCPQSDLNLDGSKDVWTTMHVPVGTSAQSSGIFSIASSSTTLPSRASVLVAVGGDYLKPDETENTAAFRNSQGETWQSAAHPPHGYRSSVAYDPQTKTWITVGPNGTDISRDDGRTWQALHPAATESPDADKNWNALSLPFVVGPRGRIGILSPQAELP